MEIGVKEVKKSMHYKEAKMIECMVGVAVFGVNTYMRTHHNVHCSNV